MKYHIVEESQDSQRGNTEENRWKEREEENRSGSTDHLSALHIRGRTRPHHDQELVFFLPKKTALLLWLARLLPLKVHRVSYCIDPYLQSALFSMCQLLDHGGILFFSEKQSEFSNPVPCVEYSLCVHDLFTVNWTEFLESGPEECWDTC